jgi:hypothetical protein
MARLGALRFCVASDSVPIDNYHGATQMTLRQFLQDNFGWDIYDWADDEIRF